MQIEPFFDLNKKMGRKSSYYSLDYKAKSCVPCTVCAHMNIVVLFKNKIQNY